MMVFDRVTTKLECSTFDTGHIYAMQKSKLDAHNHKARLPLTRHFTTSIITALVALPKDFDYKTTLTMAFNAETHCSPQIQQRCGLFVHDDVRVRAGEKSKEIPGTGSFQFQGYKVRNTLKEAHAQLIWSHLNVAEKASPSTPLIAQAYSLVSQMAGNHTPDPLRVGGKEAKQDPLVQYNSIGSPIFMSVTDCQKFVSFLYLNMDEDHRIPWNFMTGAEQVEWFDSWKEAGGSNAWVRFLGRTNGLRGTDPTRIQNDQQSIRQAILNSPSRSRRGRPAHLTEENAAYYDQMISHVTPR